MTEFELLLAAFQATAKDLGLADRATLIEDPEQVGRRLAHQLESELAWRQHVGGDYNLSQVQKLLGGCSRQAVHQRLGRGTLLAIKREGSLVFPSFQFGPDGQRYSVLSLALRALKPARLHPATMVSWFRTPQPELDGQTPAEWMRAGNDRKRLIEAARHTASPLSR